MLVCKKSIFSQADTMPAYENESGKTKNTRGQAHRAHPQARRAHPCLDPQVLPSSACLPPPELRHRPPTTGHALSVARSGPGSG